MAKGYCQDENKYVVEGEGNCGSTSTPERKKGWNGIAVCSLDGYLRNRSSTVKLCFVPGKQGEKCVRSE